MTYDIFLMRVMHRTGIEDRILAQELVHHVVEHLAHCLPPTMAESLAEELPQPLADGLRENADAGSCDLDGLYHAVAEELSVDVSFGLEFAQVVFQVLGEAMGRKGRDLLQMSLPDEWHPHFEPRQTPMRPMIAPRDSRRTLAGGQPGSSRPLSGARPGHRNSIAHSDSPHMGQKLSTSHGKPDHRTLAGGKPGSSRPISDA